jgi:cell fate regulator YaaT (PSP1 superfamily)
MFHTLAFALPYPKVRSQISALSFGQVKNSFLALKSKINYKELKMSELDNKYDLNDNSLQQDLVK